MLSIAAVVLVAIAHAIGNIDKLITFCPFVFFRTTTSVPYLADATVLTRRVANNLVTKWPLVSWTAFLDLLGYLNVEDAGLVSFHLALDLLARESCKSRFLSVQVVAVDSHVEKLSARS
jgi:hypothetical protein